MARLPGAGHQTTTVLREGPRAVPWESEAARHRAPASNRLTPRGGPSPPHRQQHGNRAAPESPRELGRLPRSPRSPEGRPAAGPRSSPMNSLIPSAPWASPSSNRHAAQGLASFGLADAGGADRKKEGNPTAVANLHAARAPGGSMPPRATASCWADDPLRQPVSSSKAISGARRSASRCNRDAVQRAPNRRCRLPLHLPHAAGFAGRWRPDTRLRGRGRDCCTQCKLVRIAAGRPLQIPHPLGFR